jgi:hypothetical protein
MKQTSEVEVTPFTSSLIICQEACCSVERGGGGKERFMKDQFFSPSYDLAPPPLSCEHVASLSQILYVTPVELSVERGVGVGGVV